MPGKKRTVIAESKLFTLTRHEREGKKTWFEIKVNQWQFRFSSIEERDQALVDIDTLFESKGRRTQPMQQVWNFWKYEDAYQCYTMALMKWTT